MSRQMLHAVHCAERKFDRAKRRMDTAAALLAYRSNDLVRAREQLKQARALFRKRTKGMNGRLPNFRAGKAQEGGR